MLYVVQEYMEMPGMPQRKTFQYFTKGAAFAPSEQYLILYPYEAP